MRKVLLIFSVLLLLLASCKTSENIVNKQDKTTTEPISIGEEETHNDNTTEPIVTGTAEDTYNDNSSESSTPEPEFVDIAPDGITYLKLETDNYLDKKGISDYGYITKIEESEITINHVRWITSEDKEWDDSWNSPNGFHILDDSGADIQHTIADDCEIWMLHNHVYPSYQISFEDMLTYIEMTSWDILWRFEIKDGKIITIYEQYLP